MFSHLNLEHGVYNHLIIDHNYDFFSASVLPQRDWLVRVVCRLVFDIVQTIAVHHDTVKYTHTHNAESHQIQWVKGDKREKLVIFIVIVISN